jgi:hypothetical protein
LNLYHNQTLIGKIEGVSPNGFDFHAAIELTPESKQYEQLFEYWTDDEKNPADEGQFADQLFENWSVEDYDGERQEIYLPGIFMVNGVWEIMWRYV